ncbi:hypothetical protein SARC_15354, partial [Sphaeroforma arctica JP610]
NVAQFYRGVCLGNSAGSSGGAAYANNVLVNNSVFDGNQCGTNGGAIYSGESLDATLGHFADNLGMARPYAHTHAQGSEWYGMVF